MSRALIGRILASSGFSRSDRLSHFLKYAYQKTIEGHPEDLSEYQIGLNVFGRSERYSPGEDSIVRSHARLLRQRLDAYFTVEGKAEEIRVTIPKGAYSLRFENRQPEPAPLSQTGPVPLAPRRRWPLLAGLVVAAVALPVALYWALRPASVADAVWTRVFSANTRTIIVPADSTLALYEDLTNQVVSLSDYLSRSYHNRPEASGFAERIWAPGRRYTSIADLQICTRLMRLPQARSKDVVIRYARDLQMADLKGSNSVLLGGLRANPWQEIFQDKLNFRIGYDSQRLENRVIDVSPRDRETATYNEKSDAGFHRAYGIVAFLPGLRSDTSVVVIQGTSTAGTEAAADFLFDDRRFEAFLRQIGASNNRPPYFELLLQADNIGGNAQQASFIASRVIPPAPP